MKKALIEQVWNLFLISIAVGTGLIFPYEIGLILSGFSPATGWVDVTGVVGIIFGIPVLAIFFLSSFGREGWYIWLGLACLPIVWMFIPGGDFDDLLFFAILLAVPLASGLILRGLINKLLLPKIFAK